MEAESTVGAESAEAERVASDLLPVLIRTTGGIAAAVGIVGVGLAFAKDWVFLLGPAITSLLGAPLLYGFADVVLSLRKLCQRP